MVPSYPKDDHAVAVTELQDALDRSITPMLPHVFLTAALVRPNRLDDAEWRKSAGRSRWVGGRIAAVSAPLDRPRHSLVAGATPAVGGNVRIRRPQRPGLWVSSAFCASAAS